MSVAAESPRPAESIPVSLFPVRSVWTLALNNQLTIPPAYDSKRAYFAIDGDRLVCYTLIDGTQQWLVSARTLMQPAAGDDLIFSIEPDLLVARQATDGSVAWQLPLTDTLAVRPVWDNGWLVAATTSGSILAFRGSDGQLIWQRDIGSAAQAPPALAADRIYVPTADGRVVALRVDTGTPVWERRLGAAPGDVLALDDRLYVGSSDNFLYCLKAKDGSVDWRSRTGGDVIGLPAADARNVYFVSLDNVLRALSRTSGAQRWMRPLPLRPVWGPVAVGLALFVGGQATTLHAYNVKDGNAAGEVGAGADVSAAPHAVADPESTRPLLLVVTRDIAKGAEARLVTRSIDPETATLAPPLPNLGTLVPVRPESPQQPNKTPNY